MLPSRRLPWVVFGAVLAVYLVLVALHGRLFNIDEVFYKAAGGNWAVLGRFAAPELTGRLPFDPPIAKVFACYPPLYPFAFGVFSRVFGFGYTQLSLFDALLRVALCAVTAFTVLRLGAGLVRQKILIVPDDGVGACAFEKGACASWLAVSAGLFVLPLGAIGRPDDLAKIFGLLACVRLLAAVRRGEAWQAGVLLGFSAAASLVAGGVFAAIATGLVAVRPEEAPRRRGLVIGGMGVISALTLLALCAPLLLIDGGAWRQVLMHGADNLLRTGLWEAWTKGWVFGKYTLIASLMAHVAVLPLLVWVWRTGRLRAWLACFAAPLLLFVCFVLKTDGKFYYLWFAGPWMGACMVVFVAHEWAGRAGRIPLVIASGIMVAGALYGAQFWVVERLVLANLPAEQRFGPASERAKAQVPPGEPIIVFEHWITFLGRNPMHDLSMPITEEERDRIRYVVVTGNGSREPGKTQRQLPNMQPYVDANFRLVQDDLAREPLRLFGIRITNSAYGYGTAVLERKD